ncbi:MAG: response regulator [Desulfatitalea sp.]|nr:response regulator [Desulfatitalea sp.]NNK02137.1 response regulator [Desulfatitalea sp.]
MSEADILIVDDDDGVWRLFNATLRLGGHTCHRAASAAEARQMLTQREFDLVLCDIVMPGESGLTLCRHIYDTLPDLPVIIVTGMSGMETAREAMAMDVYGYIVKPADQSQIRISVANALRRRELEAQRRAQHRHLEQQVRIRTHALTASNAALRRSETLLAQKATELEELNRALSVLLKKQEADRDAMEARMLTNVHKAVRPYLEKLKTARLSAQQRKQVEMVEAGIRRIISPFAESLSTVGRLLTPGEFQVADLVRQGKSTKEIAVLLNLSENTVMTHRYKIRTKLGLKNRKQNMRTYLNTLSR